MTKNRIMVVEDEGITALRIQNSLKKFGYTVTSTLFSGEKAVKKVEEDRPDLVLMDIVLMGKMDGIEAAKRIHSRYKLPVVYLTAYSDDKMMKRIRKTEPFGYIFKPFDDNELHMTIEIELYKHEMEEKLRKSENALRTHKEQLEDIVKDRTADLISTNELLREEIGDRRLAEAEALRASHLAALGELAAGVAHEINNPINGIINYAQLLTNKSKQGSDEQDVANRIIKESERIANIVKNLLLFARESQDEKRPVHIKETIYDSLALNEAQLRKDGIDLEIDIQNALPEIIAQPQQLVQVFLNVISNARHALCQNHQGANINKILRITAKETSVDDCRYIQIQFYDNGIGIPAGIMDKIVNPFFTTKPVDIGTGLGLSISHGIIKKHGGTIALNSEEGKFTEVIIELPVKLMDRH